MRRALFRGPRSSFWLLDLHRIRAHIVRVKVMLKNITLSAESKLVDAARERAQQERTTLNNVFREWLARYASKDGGADRYRQLMRELKHVSAGRTFSRDELNER